MAIPAKKTVSSAAIAAASAPIDAPEFPAPAALEAPGPASAPATAAEKTTEAATAPVAALHDTMRKALEKSVAETRASYAKAKAAAEEVSGAVEASTSAAAKGLVELNGRALDALRVNAEAHFDFLRAVIGVKSPAEFVTLQTEHVRKQGESIVAQTKDMAALSRKVAQDSAEPIKSQVAKTFKLAV